MRKGYVITFAIVGTIAAATLAYLATNTAPQAVTLFNPRDSLAEFQNYAAQYAKDYSTTEEYQRRKAIFEENLKTISEHAAKDIESLELGLN